MVLFTVECVPLLFGLRVWATRFKRRFIRCVLHSYKTIKDLSDCERFMWGLMRKMQRQHLTSGSEQRK
jgi:hypothetical protein